MLKNINDTMDACARYFIVWLVQFLSLIPSIALIVLNVIYLQNNWDGSDIKDSTFISSVAIISSILLVELAIFIACFVSIISLITKIGKVQEALGGNYQTYFALCVIGIFFPFFCFNSCFFN